MKIENIKYRVWNKSKNTLVYSDELNQKTPAENVGLLFIMTNLSPDDFEFTQFTGLKDKNGKEIYEGDIVKVFGQAEIPCDDRKDFEIITYDHTGTVVFDSGCCVFKNHLTREQLIEHVKYFPESDSDIICDFNSFLGVEVIGNIYKNPDLLK